VRDRRERQTLTWQKRRRPLRVRYLYRVAGFRVGRIALHHRQRTCPATVEHAVTQK